jgi:hypothetical protein
MTKILSARSILAFIGLVLVVSVLSFSGNASEGTVDRRECQVNEDREQGNELLWESLSRQFSGSVSCY